MMKGRKRNTEDNTCLYLVCNGKAWQARVTYKGISESKTFSFEKYGKINAKRRAREWRDERRKSLRKAVHQKETESARQPFLPGVKEPTHTDLAIKLEEHRLILRKVYDVLDELRKTNMGLAHDVAKLKQGNLFSSPKRI